MNCPECNTPAQKGDTYCQNCGHQFVVNPVRTGVDPETGRIIPGTVITPSGQVIPTSPAPIAPSVPQSATPPQAEPVHTAQPTAPTAQPLPATDGHDIFSDRPTVSDEKFMSAGVAAGRERRTHSKHKAVNAIIGTLIVLTLIGSAYFVGFHTNLLGLGQPDEPTYALPLQGTPAVSD